MRVDVEKDLSGTTRHYHARAPLPVVQINDQLMGMTILQIGGFSASGFAAKDENGNIGVMRRGDHRVAFWAAASTGEQMIVCADHIDFDRDGSNFATSTSPPVSITAPNAPLAATSTTLASSLNRSYPGQSVTFTATVTSPGGTPTGTVTFMDGPATLGAVPLISGAAQLTTSLSLPSGCGGCLHVVTALYSGDSNFAASSSAPLYQIVVVPLSLTSSLNPSNTGQSVTFTASALATLGEVPVGGTVTFKDGTNTLGTTALISDFTAGMNRSRAQFTTSTLSAGHHSITLVYSGGSSPDFTSAPLIQVVLSPPPPDHRIAVHSIVVTSSAVLVDLGTPSTFTATLTPAPGIVPVPMGTVHFLDGASLLGSVPVVNGKAVFTVTLPIRGHHSISAVYGGDAVFRGGISPVFLQGVH